MRERPPPSKSLGCFRDNVLQFLQPPHCEGQQWGPCLTDEETEAHCGFGIAGGIQVPRLPALTFLNQPQGLCHFVSPTIGVRLQIWEHSLEGLSPCWRVETPFPAAGCRQVWGSRVGGWILTQLCNLVTLHNLRASLSWL